MHTHAPYAKFQDGYEDIDLTIYNAGYYIGYRSDFFNNPDRAIYSCKDELLAEDWNNADFVDELASTRTKIWTMLNEHEKKKIEDIEDAFVLGDYKYGLSYHEQNPLIFEKVLY